uniref:Uncharacterized protein n=1 Tax=Oncorhynchus tshawytscha TaxID=74940 RepID=A0A8C8EXQ0_ONCTS
MFQFRSPSSTNSEDRWGAISSHMVSRAQLGTSGRSFKEQPWKTEGSCVVYCKWKTHHLTIIRRKQRSTGRTYDIVYMDPWEFPPTAYHTNKTDEAGSKDNDYFSEVNVGELLTYFLRIKDTCNLDDESESSSVSIGCCVDLYPLVKKVLTMLKHWWPDLSTSRGTNAQSMDGTNSVCDVCDIRSCFSGYRLLPVSVAMLAMVAHVKLKS